MFEGPGTLKVYVPPESPPRPENNYRDFPPHEPPEVHYQGVTANYSVVLEEGEMRYMGRMKVFSKEQMDWLRSIKPDVEKILRETD